MKVLVAYESRSGKTKGVAEAIAAAASEHDVVCKPLADVRSYDVDLAQVVFIGSWVKGFIVVGVGPAHKAMKYLEDFGSLEGKQAAVFCTYDVNPRRTLDTMRGMLAVRGATVLGERAFRRGDTEDAPEFATQVLEAAAAMRVE